MKRNFRIKGEVWRWPGDGGWHFVNVDKKISGEIRKIFPKGFVKVVAKCGKSEWVTSLFPHNKPVSYLLCVSKKIRKAEGIFEGDRVSIEIKIK